MIELINDRKIHLIDYRTDYNWTKNLPEKNWLCIIHNNTKERNYIDEIASKIIDKNVCYICTTGNLCEAGHDFIDEIIVYREADIENYFLPDHVIMTTWDYKLKEGLWYGIYGAVHYVEIKEVVIINMENSIEHDKIRKTLVDLKNEGF